MLAVIVVVFVVVVVRLLELGIVVGCELVALVEKLGKVEAMAESFRTKLYVEAFSTMVAMFLLL